MQNLEKNLEKINVEAPSIEAFQKLILEDFYSSERPLPWRYIEDAWAIFISEIMLQQTQVDRVIPYWTLFYKRWPNPNALAKANLAEVLEAWAGLGYNRRARFLLEAAKKILSDFNGEVTQSEEELKTLPGVGPYTAAAVACFAFGAPRVLIETNIRAVFLHFFFQGRDNVHDNEILPLIGESLWAEDPRTWNYALMDYGWKLKKLVRNPSRRSKHYNRQSPFEGSHRQLRGEVLRHFCGQKELSYTELLAILKVRRSTIKNLKTENLGEALGELVAEGFLEKKEDLYRIVQD